jgi:hypothetical protein
MGLKHKDKSHDKKKKCNANSPLAKRQYTGRYIYIIYDSRNIMKGTNWKILMKLKTFSV